MPENDAPAFSRSGEADPLGKLDARLDVNVPEQMKEDCVFVARACGFATYGEWVRGILSRELYGQVDTIQRVMRGNATMNGMKKG